MVAGSSPVVLVSVKALENACFLGLFLFLALFYALPHLTTSEAFCILLERFGAKTTATFTATFFETWDI